MNLLWAMKITNFYIFYVHFAQLNVSLIEMKREYTFLISIIAQLISNFKHTKKTIWKGTAISYRVTTYD